MGEGVAGAERAAEKPGGAEEKGSEGEQTLKPQTDIKHLVFTPRIPSWLVEGGADRWPTLTGPHGGLLCPGLEAAAWT